MKLTGKTKEAFEKWCDEQLYDRFPSQHHINELDEVCLNALIIEFFDSVGIYICTGIHKYNGISSGFNSCIEQIRKETIFFKPLLTRLEATNKAIIKANELYNEKLSLLS